MNLSHLGCFSEMTRVGVPRLSYSINPLSDVPFTTYTSIYQPPPSWPPSVSAQTTFNERLRPPSSRRLSGRSIAVSRDSASSKEVTSSKDRTKRVRLGTHCYFRHGHLPSIWTPLQRFALIKTLAALSGREERGGRLIWFVGGGDGRTKVIRRRTIDWRCFHGVIVPETPVICFHYNF